MSTQALYVPAPSSLLPAITQRFVRFGRAVWRALEEQGRKRSRPELLALAARYEVQQPALAAEMRAAANHVRTTR